MQGFNLTWWTGEGGKNFGDAISPIIAEAISGKKANLVPVGDKSEVHRFLSTGSILPCTAPNYEVWGSGIMHEDAKIEVKPKAVHAVRGKLTREVLLKNGVECPEVYGDPCLLYPLFYKPIRRKRFRIGIIPHYVDQDNEWVKKFSQNPFVKVINILNEPQQVVREVIECDMIFSSSLHGVIVGDAYGIPSYWIELSNKVHGKGFKFRDYFSSVNRPMLPAIDPQKFETTNRLEREAYNYHLEIDLVKLLKSCPF